MSGIRYAAEFPRHNTKADVLEWCNEHFGPSGFKARWMPLDYTIQFRDERDRNWFFLKWGV